MIALTLIDDNKENPTPWASLMEVGLKTAETRKWAVPRTDRLKMPFDLLICASATSRTANRGRAVCVVELYECLPFAAEHEREACCDLYPGFAWFTRNLRWLSYKFPVKGQLGLFDYDLDPSIKLYVPTPEQLHQARLALKSQYAIA